VGLGSGGYPSVQHLAMFGVQNWILIDRDTLGAENLEKHPGMRRDIGRMKTEIAQEWILDRNPNAQVECINTDITLEEGRIELERAIQKSDALLSFIDNSQVSDNNASRGGASLNRLGYLTANNRPLIGGISEYIIYNADKSTDRAAIETNINDFYSIY
jgi:hypothetical protein